MKKILIIIIYLLCNNVTELAAQQATSSLPVFTFKPHSTSDIPDTVRVFFRKGPLVDNSAGERIKIKPNFDGSFTFSPSFKQPIYWMEVYFMYYKKRQRAKSSVYYAQPNDNIKILYTKNPDTIIGVIPKMKFDFSGNGKDKYEAVQQLEEFRKEMINNLNQGLIREFGPDNDSKNKKIESPNYSNSSELDKYLKSVLENVNNANLQTKNTLFKYKEKIDPNVIMYLNYEMSNSFYFSYWIDYLYHISKSQNFQKAITDFYFNNKNVVVKDVYDSLVKYSADYKFNKLRETMYETTFLAKDGKIPFSFQYDAVKRIGNKELNNMLVTLFIQEPWFHQRITNTDTQDSCIRDAINEIKSPELLKPIKEQLVFFRGSVVPEFSFSDISGNQTTLHDLKGKVFMIDFYFYGCQGCIAYAKRFKEKIYPEFSNNPNFKVLSVSIDKSREHWVAAMNSSLYNEKSYINLTTGSVEWKHPFLQHYNRSAFPFILLVDKNGKLITKIEDHSNSVISDLIKNALGELQNTK